MNNSIQNIGKDRRVRGRWGEEGGRRRREGERRRERDHRGKGETARKKGRGKGVKE